MNEYDNHHRVLYLRFAWGRSRLPLCSADFDRKHEIELYILLLHFIYFYSVLLLYFYIFYIFYYLILYFRLEQNDKQLP